MVSRPMARLARRRTSTVGCERTMDASAPSGTVRRSRRARDSASCVAGGVRSLTVTCSGSRCLRIVSAAAACDCAFDAFQPLGDVGYLRRKSAPRCALRDRPHVAGVSDVPGLAWSLSWLITSAGRRGEVVAIGCGSTHSPLSCLPAEGLLPGIGHVASGDDERFLAFSDRYDQQVTPRVSAIQLMRTRQFLPCASAAVTSVMTWRVRAWLAIRSR